MLLRGSSRSGVDGGKGGHASGVNDISDTERVEFTI